MEGHEYAIGKLWDSHGKKVADETLEATTRILGIADDTHKIGLNTLMELNQQGEQLQNIRNKVDDIEADVSHTKWLLRSAFGCCYCLWNPLKPHQEKFNYINKVCI